MQRQLMKCLSVSSLPAATTTTLQELAFAHPRGLKFLSLSVAQCYFFYLFTSSQFICGLSGLGHMGIFSSVIFIHLFKFSFQFLNFLASASVSNCILDGKQEATTLFRLCFCNMLYVVMDDEKCGFSNSLHYVTEC